MKYSSLGAGCKKEIAGEVNIKTNFNSREKKALLTLF